MKILELFAGYGSQALALENLGIEFTSDISEIDKYAIQAYNQLHGETHNWGDITKIDESKLPYYDLITYSFPCQDISLAGLQRGLDNGAGTRSSLLWECERIIRAVKPKYLLMENVKNLVGEKHKHNFIRWLRVLEMMGYQNFWQVLNAKDYGVPQNRERVFVVSILGGGQYLFPNPIKLEKRLKDVLESNVDEKYYLSDKIIDTFIRRNAINSEKGNGSKFEPTDGEKYAKAITTRAGGRADDNYIQEPLCVAQRGRENGQNLEINETGCTNTLTSVQKDNYIIVPEATKQGYAKAHDGDSINLDQPNSETRRGRVGHQMANTLTCACNQAVVQQIGNIVETEQTSQCGHTTTSSSVLIKYNNYRIRKLTPRECWRLMGVKDEQYDKLHDISNAQLYKLAGNSIVVDVLMGIFKNLLLSDEGTSGQLTLL